MQAHPNGCIGCEATPVVDIAQSSCPRVENVMIWYITSRTSVQRGRHHHFALSRKKRTRRPEASQTFPRKRRQRSHISSISIIIGFAFALILPRPSPQAQHDYSTTQQKATAATNQTHFGHALKTKSGMQKRRHNMKQLRNANA